MHYIDRPLRIEGRVSDPIWAMEDGDSSSPIGLRLDCGGAGVLYLSRKQAQQIIETLVQILV